MFNLGVNKKKGTVKQKRITVNFRENEEEQELYNWIIKNGKVGGTSNLIKNIVYEKYKKQLEKEK